MQDRIIGLNIAVAAGHTTVQASDSAVSGPRQHHNRISDGLDKLRGLYAQGGLNRAYGEKLYQHAFSGPAGEWLQEALEPVLISSMPRGSFRLQLELLPDLPALHELLWEGLRPGRELPIHLGYSDKGGFYRLVRSDVATEEGVDRQRGSEVRVLAAIADPQNPRSQSSGSRSMASRQRECLSEVLGQERVEFVDPPVRLATIRDHLCAAAPLHNVFHLVAPGGKDRLGPYFSLDGANGEPERVRPGDLESVVAEAGRGLGLVVLIANHTAHYGRSFRDAGFGIRLSRRGPAVVAIQGTIATEAAVAFTDRFYTYVVREGRRPIDQAVNIARNRLPSRKGSRPTPVLFAAGDEALERFTPPIELRLAQDADDPRAPSPTLPRNSFQAIAPTAAGTPFLRQWCPSAGSYARDPHRSDTHSEPARRVSRFSAFWSFGGRDEKEAA